MFTKAEKGYLALTLGFLAAGSGIKAYRHAGVKLGPFADPSYFSEKSASFRPDSASPPAGSDSTSMNISLASFADASVRDSSSAATSGQEAIGPDSREEGVNDSSNGAGNPESSRSASQKPSGSARATGTVRSAVGSKSGFKGKVDLNRADAAELSQVRGVGAKTAQAIVEYRRAHGPYRDFRDLLQLKGIGEKKLEKLIPYLIL